MPSEVFAFCVLYRNELSPKLIAPATPMPPPNVAEPVEVEFDAVVLATFNWPDRDKRLVVTAPEDKIKVDAIVAVPPTARVPAMERFVGIEKDIDMVVKFRTPKG